MQSDILLPDTDQFPLLSFEDVLAGNVIKNERLAVEPELFKTKWWDYRFMSPFEATFEYIDAFGNQARKIYAREFDYERAQHIRVATGPTTKKGLLEDNPKARKSFAGFWRGRQVADAVGAPYDVFIYQAMTSRMRAWKRTHLPNADQLYGERDVEFVARQWEDIKASRVFYAEHHAYLAQNYIGAPIQQEYCQYLLDRSRTTGDRVNTLVDMIESDRLPIEFIQRKEPGIYEQVVNSLR